jgi:hypothetical protein
MKTGIMHMHRKIELIRVEDEERPDVKIWITPTNQDYEKRPTQEF